MRLGQFAWLNASVQLFEEGQSIAELMKRIRISGTLLIVELSTCNTKQSGCTRKIIKRHFSLIKSFMAFLNQRLIVRVMYLSSPFLNPQSNSWTCKRSIYYCTIRSRGSTSAHFSSGMYCIVHERVYCRLRVGLPDEKTEEPQLNAKNRRLSALLTSGGDEGDGTSAPAALRAVSSPVGMSIAN